MICLITENCAGISGIVFQVPFFFFVLCVFRWTVRITDVQCITGGVGGPI